MFFKDQFFDNRVAKSQEDDDNEPIGEAKAFGLNFETIHNIDEYATETVTTMREALKVMKTTFPKARIIWLLLYVILLNWSLLKMAWFFVLDVEHDGSILVG